MSVFSTLLLASTKEPPLYSHDFQGKVDTSIISPGTTFNVGIVMEPYQSPTTVSIATDNSGNFYYDLPSGKKICKLYLATTGGHPEAILEFAFGDYALSSNYIYEMFANMFQGCYILEYVNLGRQNLIANTFQWMFNECYNLISVDFSGVSIDQTTQPLTSVQGMFSNCKSLRNIVGINNIDFTHVQDASRMFQTCWAYDFSQLHLYLPNCTNFDFMFAYCDNLDYIDISDWGIASNVSSWAISVANMFYYDWNLETIIIGNVSTGVTANFTGVSGNRLSNFIPDLSTVTAYYLDNVNTPDAFRQAFPNVNWTMSPPPSN